MYVVYRHPETLDIAADTAGLLDSGELLSAAAAAMSAAAMSDNWPCLHAWHFKCPSRITIRLIYLVTGFGQMCSFQQLALQPLM